jgi:membrane fusion protein, heavy metal efflux system
MAMIRIVCVGLLLSAAASAFAEGETVMHLGLTSGDLDRLGVTLDVPRIVTEIEIATGPAVVTVPPAREAVVTSTVGGVLSRVLVAEGDYVSAGQPLAELVSSELLELQREYIEAGLATDLARAQLNRDRGLSADGIIADRRVQESEAAERAATTTLDQIRQQLLLAGMSQSELTRLLQTRELSSTLTLKAPFAAFVVEQLSALGARVDALDPVYHIADLSELWLELHVPQEKSDQIKAGMPIVAATAAGNIEGQVSQVGRVADAASQTILVRGRIDNPDPTLRVGQYLPSRVLGIVIDGRTAHAVPSAAVVRMDDAAYVFGVHDNQIAAVPVEIISEDGINTYVRGDLLAGGQIAVGGVASLKSVWVSKQDAGE